MKIKVVLYIPRPNYGGVTKVLLNLAKNMQKYVDVCVLTNKGFLDNNSVLPLQSNITYYELPSNSNLLNVFFAGFVLKRLKASHLVTASPLISCFTLISKLLFYRKVKVVV